MTTESLPPVSQTKFKEMGEWAKGAFDQIESMGRFGIKEGNDDQAIIDRALESFSKDVAYSGVVAAYERSQSLVWTRDDGPLATKFDILIHHFDTTKELLTNTEARRQVQAVIVNLCGGTERYKYLYEDGEESFAVANLVEAAVGLWGRSQSKQAKIDEAAALMVRQREVAQKAIDQVGISAASEWGEEQRAAAEKFYNETMKPDEQTKVDALVRSLLTTGQSEEILIETIGNLLQAKHDWDFAKGTMADFDWIAEQALGVMLKADSVRENLLAVMSIREAPKKGKDRGEQIIQNHTFYIQLADALRWRVEQIGVEKQVREKVVKKLDGLDFRLSIESESDVIIDPAVASLMEEAKKLNIPLPSRPFEANAVSEGVSSTVGAIRVTVKEGWQLGIFSLEYLPFNNNMVDNLTAVAVLVNQKEGWLKLTEGYSLEKIGKEFFFFKSGGEKIEVIADGGNFVLGLAEEVAVKDGLEAMAVLGRVFNDFSKREEKFPALILELKQPEGKPVPLTERTSGRVLEAQTSVGSMPEPEQLQKDAIMLQIARAIQKNGKEDNSAEIRRLETQFDRVFGSADNNGLFSRAFGASEGMEEYNKRLVELGIEVAAAGKIERELDQQVTMVYIGVSDQLLKTDKNLKPKMSFEDFKAAFYVLVEVPEDPVSAAEESEPAPEEGAVNAPVSLPDWLQEFRENIQPPVEPPAAEEEKKRKQISLNE